MFAFRVSADRCSDMTKLFFRLVSSKYTDLNTKFEEESEVIFHNEDVLRDAKVHVGFGRDPPPVHGIMQTLGNICRRGRYPHENKH